MAGWSFDDVLRRWILAGGDDKIRFAVPDSNVGAVVGVHRFVGTLVATVNVGSLGGLALGTLSGVPVGIAAGDKVLVTPKGAMTLGLFGAFIPAADTINIQLFNMVGAAGNQGPLGFDVLVVKTE